jgi:hypothetical protein
MSDDDYINGWARKIGVIVTSPEWGFCGDEVLTLRRLVRELVDETTQVERTRDVLSVAFYKARAAKLQAALRHIIDDPRNAAFHARMALGDDEDRPARTPGTSGEP